MGTLPVGYHTVCWRDDKRNATVVELIEDSTDDEVAEVLFFDATRELTLIVFQESLPTSVIDLFEEEAIHVLQGSPKD